ncbi:regulatory protein, gntR family [Pilibacter termitis]|uniref:Regulatory protein, gntR family n=2 Tax=Pilibacter termitis TaxID=263852 RepID=A0A1T4LMI9_9ENTE|nr:regulatory protein, gntR family [Pilibacter termitis]
MKYLVVYETLKEEIFNEKYAINEQLPNGRELAELFHVSMLTIKKAMDRLVLDGIIVRRRGDGSYVKDWKKMDVAQHNHLSGTFNQFSEGEVKTKVLKFEVERADEKIAAKLSIQAGDFIYAITRLRIIRGIPSIIEYTFMPLDLIPNLQMSHVETSIYNYIQRDLRLMVHSAVVKITGVRPDDFEKKELHLKSNSFLLQVDQVASLDNSRVFEFSIAKHIPEEFEFETVIVSNKK